MIESVKLENWKSHHETELEFSPGVNALVGTMGSGKSSVLEAITFALYGTTPKLNSREITLDDVIRRTPDTASEAVVEVSFRVEDEEYTVKRTIERGSGTERSELRRSGELIEAPSTQEVTEQVEKHLGMNFKSFTRAIYSEQNNLDLFLEMRPGDRKERIDELLELDRFESARQTAVKVKNRLENERERKQEELAELSEEFDGEMLEEIGEELEEKREEREENRKKIEELEEKLEEKEEELDELEDEKEVYESVKERITKLETRLESLEEQREELEAPGIEDPGEKRGELEEKLEELEEVQEKLESTGKDVEHLKERSEQVRKEIGKLEEKVEKFRELEGVEEELEDVEERIESIKEKGNRLYGKRTDLEESLEELREAEGDCPTCGQDLDEGHREKLIEKRRKKIQDMKEQENDLRDNLEQKQEEKGELEEKRKEMLRLKDAEEKLEEKEEELDELEEELEDKKQEKDRLDEKLSDDRIGKLESRIEELEEAEEALELGEKMEELNEELEEAEEELEETSFREEKLKELREDISSLKETRSGKVERLSSLEELIEEKEKRKEQLESQMEKQEELEEELELLDERLDYIHSYRKALENTQVSLREMFVERLNQLMDRIWKQVYPYDDYYSIRLNAEEGYLLQLLDAENNWIGTEEVSGGERHSAALVMRLALTFVLSPRLQVLILDEPTHNLDSSAVDELAETLRERTSDLIDQLFVVTHDPGLESAASGKLYRFEKKGTETGLTDVRELEQ